MKKDYRKEIVFDDGIGFTLEPDHLVATPYSDSYDMVNVKLETFQSFSKVDQNSSTKASHSSTRHNQHPQKAITELASLVFDNTHQEKDKKNLYQKPSLFQRFKNFMIKSIMRNFDSKAVQVNATIVLSLAFITGLLGSTNTFSLSAVLAGIVGGIVLITGFSMLEVFVERDKENTSIDDTKDDDETIKEAVDALESKNIDENNDNINDDLVVASAYEDFTYNFKLHKKVMNNLDKIPKKMWRKLYVHASQIHQLREDLYKIQKLDKTSVPEYFVNELKSKETILRDNLHEQTRKFNLTTRGLINIVEGRKITPSKNKITSAEEVLDVLVELDEKYKNSRTVDEKDKTTANDDEMFEYISLMHNSNANTRNV